jgi:hypothetical protein
MLDERLQVLSLASENVRDYSEVLYGVEELLADLSLFISELKHEIVVHLESGLLIIVAAFFVVLINLCVHFIKLFLEFIKSKELRCFNFTPLLQEVMAVFVQKYSIGLRSVILESICNLDYGCKTAAFWIMGVSW